MRDNHKEEAKKKYADNQAEITELGGGGQRVIAMGREMGARAATMISFIMLLMSAGLLIMSMAT